MRILGRVVVGDQLELPDSFDRWRHLVVLRLVSTAERDAVVIGLILEATAAANRSRPRAGGSDARREFHESGGCPHLAAHRERQIEKPLRLHYHPYFHRLGG